MKKFVMSSLLALSSTLAVVGVTQASAADYTQNQTAAQNQDRQARGQWAQGGHHRGGQHRGMGEGGINRGAMSQLNLTDAQKAQIDTIREAQRAKHESEQATHQAERQQRREQMQALMNSSTLNTATLNRLANEHAEQAKQRFIERVQTQHAIAQVLTAEQRTQLEQMRDERGERHTGQRGMRGDNR